MEASTPAPRPIARSALLCVAGLATLACSRGVPQESGAKAAAASETAREVTTARVEDAVWARTLHATGELVAFAEATVGSKVAGRVESFAVDVGTRVKRGEALARIDARDYELRRTAALAALQAARARLGLTLDGDSDSVTPENTALVRLAQAQLDDAQRIRDRLADVTANGAAPKAEYDTALANVAIAESRKQDALEETQNRRAQLAQRRADLAIADQQLADTLVVAPFDGTVRERLAAVGDFLAVGTPVAALVRFDPLRLRAQVSERDATMVASGQPVRFRITGDPQLRTAKVTRTSPSIDVSSRTLMIECDVENASAELRPGSFAEVEIETDPTAHALAVPVEAIASFAGVDKVFVVRSGKVLEVHVTTGRRDAHRVEILSGAALGDEVVLTPGNLRTGAAVHAAGK